MSPAPSLLSRDQIVTAAIELLDAAGADGFSMRRLGAALGVDPMAVYHHVPNKAALFDLVVDRLWTWVAASGIEGDTWQEVVAGTARALRRELLAHPRLAPVIATRPLVTPTMLVVLDATLGRLAAAGLPPAQAMELLDHAVAYTVGKVQGELRDPVGGTDQAPADVYSALTPEAFPHLVAALMSGYAWDPDGQFERGLGALVGGWGGLQNAP